MNHYGMISAENISTCQNCLAYLARLGPGAKKECLDCYYATEYGEPSIEQASSLVPVEPIDSQALRRQIEYSKSLLNHMTQKLEELRVKRKKTEPKQPAENSRIDITNKMYPNA